MASRSASNNVLTPELLTEVTRRLVAALSPRAIYLFGSQAYGGAGSTSDIDLMIVVADADELGIDYLKRAYACLQGSFLPIELHFRSESKFRLRSGVATSLEHDVISKGRRLYAA